MDSIQSKYIHIFDMNRIYSITRISTSAPLYQFLTEKKHFVSAIFLNLRKYRKLSAHACIIKMRPALRSAIIYIKNTVKSYQHNTVQGSMRSEEIDSN